jgi:hypothetical protein
MGWWRKASSAQASRTYRGVTFYFPSMFLLQVGEEVSVGVFAIQDVGGRLGQRLEDDLPTLKADVEPGATAQAKGIAH